MAIETVNARYEGFIFDGENSRDYGVYVTDVEVFGAPTRDVEMISIPGRDGEYALDKGRFNNIEVVYTCALGTGTQSDFNAGVSALRNWLASRKGYKRLEDEINAGEYRMAVFKDGLDVSTLNKETGTFKVNFDCKPQRYLKSGETAVSVSSGGTITNPTLFESSPLLEIVGYGDIGISEETVTINNLQVGKILLSAAHTGSVSYYSQEKVNSGDPIIVTAGAKWQLSFECAGTLTSFSVTPAGRANFTWNQNGASITYALPETSLVAGTSDSITFDQILIDYTYELGGEPYTVSKYFAPNINYRADYKSIALSRRADIQEPEWGIVYYSPDIYAISSVNISALGIPIYIDLDIGEAYANIDGVIVPANSNAEIPAELPTLKAGVNTFTYDNTITDFKVVPRWWEV